MSFGELFLTFIFRVKQLSISFLLLGEINPRLCVNLYYYAISALAVGRELLTLEDLGNIIL